MTIAATLDRIDPGLIRARYGLQTVGATVITWATMLAVTKLFGVVDPTRITFFGTGVCFFGALLITDPRLGDRVRTASVAAIVSAVAIVVTGFIGETRSAVAAFVLLQMFLSFALRRWSLRAGAVAGIGALTTFVASAAPIAVDRIGWFVVSSTIGFAWLAMGQRLILPDDPSHSLERCVSAFGRRAAETVALALTVARSRTSRTSPTPRSLKALRVSVDRIKTCRSVIDTQLVAVASDGVEYPAEEQLRVELYSVLAAVEQIAAYASDATAWAPLPDQMAASLDALLCALAAALSGDGRATNLVVDTAALLLDEPSDVNAHTVLPAALTTASAELAARSISRARALVSTAADATRETSPGDDAAPQTDRPPQSSARTVSPTLALAVQAVVAAVLAGVIAKWLGNDQSRVVAWTAFLVIAGSAGESAKRAWIRIVATVLGATAGVVIAASVPHNAACLLAVVVVGIFFTIVTAPVSYAGSIFFLSIAVIPLTATNGLYLDLVKDKAVAALIGGCVAAVVALTVLPVRLSRDFGPALTKYLNALDEALASYLPGRDDGPANALAELDRAHHALEAIVESTAAEVRVLPQPGSTIGERGIRVDAVQAAFLLLVPLLGDSARRLFDWTDEGLETSIEGLRVGVATANAGGGSEDFDDIAVTGGAPSWLPSGEGHPNQAVAEAHQRMLELNAALGELAACLADSSRARFAGH